MAEQCDSLEGSMRRSPWLTVCNVLWGNRLAASQHTVGSRPIPFHSLWPDGASFIELYNHGGMETSVYEIVKLLLASATMAPFDAMLSNNLITWDMKFPGNVTLTHLVCALSSHEGCERLIKDSPQKNIWEIKDRLDQDPFSLCFSPSLRRHLKKNTKALSKHSKNSPNEQPLTPEIKSQIFNLASEPEGLYDMAVLLQKYEFDINQERNDNGDLLLHVVASGGLPCLAHLFYLVRYYSADITYPNDKGLTPVHIASKIGDEKMTEMLICVFGAGVNSTDTDKKWTPLHYSARHNQPQLISMLLERGADLRKDDSDGCIPEHVAQKHSSLECFNLLEHHSKGRDERLIQEASQGTLNVRSLYPSDLTLVTSDGFTLLMKAVLGNQPSLVRDLLSRPLCPKDFKQFKLPAGPNEMPSIQVQSQKTALTMAAENGLTDCLRVLLEGGADCTIKDSMEWLPLHYGVENNHKECVRYILNHSPKGLSGLKLAVGLAEKNGRGDIAHLIREAMHKRHKEVVSPALFELARTGDKDELYQLLEDGDDVNPSNDVSDWPLYVAAGFGHVAIVKLLYESGGSVVKRHRLNLCTPLHAAARGGHVEVIRFLLGFCQQTGSLTNGSSDSMQTFLDINEKNAMQETPLELAACQGHMSVVRLLLDHGAVTTLPDSNGSLLSCPAFCGIQFLIENRRKEQMDKIARFLTEQRSLKEFRTLWKGPSDFNLRDSHGDTVLMVAAKYAKPEVMDFLLQSAVLYTPDMRIKWNYNKRLPQLLPSSRMDTLDDSLPMNMPSRKRDEYRDYRPATAFESSLKRRSKYDVRGRGHTSTTDTSEDDDSSGNYRSYYIAKKKAKAAAQYETKRLQYETSRPQYETRRPSMNGPLPSTDNYVNVVAMGTGPCTQSGLLCVVNTYDRCSALHRAIEGDQFKLIPLLLMADPNVVNIQDKHGQSALHKACHQNSKKCIQALCNSLVVNIDPMLRDVNNKLAEDLVIQPRLKKMVYNYRVKRVKESNPTNRPLPPAPLPDVQSNGNGISLEPHDPPEDPYRYRPPPQVPPMEKYNPYEHRTPKESPSRHGNNYQYHQPNGHQPSPIPAVTMEEDMGRGNPGHRDPPLPPNSSRSHNQPRYITSPRHPPAMIQVGNDDGRYNRVQRVPVIRNGSQSDDGAYSSYSRLNYRNHSPPPVPHQTPPPLLPNQSSQHDSLSRRVNNLRGVAYDDSDSFNESD